MRIRSSSSFDEIFETVEMKATQDILQESKKASKDAVSAVQSLFLRFLDLNSEGDEEKISLRERTKILRNFCRALSDAKASDKVVSKSADHLEALNEAKKTQKHAQKALGYFRELETLIVVGAGIGAHSSYCL